MTCLSAQYINKRYGWLYTLDGKVITKRQYERELRTMTGAKYLGKGITPARSARGRKAAILTSRKLRACYHDDWEVMTGGGGGCYEFPEPTWHWLRCTQCGRESERDGPADDYVGPYDDCF